MKKKHRIILEFEIEQTATKSYEVKRKGLSVGRLTFIDDAYKNIEMTEMIIK